MMKIHHNSEHIVIDYFKRMVDRLRRISFLVQMMSYLSVQESQISLL